MPGREAIAFACIARQFPSTHSAKAEKSPFSSAGRKEIPPHEVNPRIVIWARLESAFHSFGRTNIFRPVSATAITALRGKSISGKAMAYASRPSSWTPAFIKAYEP